MNNDAILASISKIHAYRYAKEKQRGALTTNGGFSTTDPTLLQIPCTIQCVFTPRTFESRQCVFDTSGSNVSPRIDILDTGNISIYYGGTAKSFAGEIGRQYNVTFVVSETEQSAYVDGELLGGVAYTTTPFLIYVLGGLSSNFTYKFQGDYLLHRHFNYAMSADEIKALDNNGNPLGYVVPKVMKDIYHSIEIIGNNSNTWTGTEDPTYSFQINVNPEMKDGHVYLVNVSISNYESGVPLIWGGTSQVALPKENGNFNILIRPTSVYTKFILIYGGYAGTDRRLTITVNSVTPVGCIAEYVAPNLVATKRGPQIEPTAESFEFDIDSSYSKRILSLLTYPFECFYKIDYIVDEWDFQPQTSGSIGFAGPQMIGPSTWYNIESAKIGEQQTCYAKMSSTGQIVLDVYGGQKTETTTSRRLKVTIVGITPISAATTWLDSAKQLPWSDAYLPPLLQSKGGYDMVANGAPEVLFKDTTVKAGVKLGYGQSPVQIISTKFTTPPISIGLSDYSIEYFGNTIGSIDSGSAFIRSIISVNEQGGIQARGYSDGRNGVNIIRFGNSLDGTTNQPYLNTVIDNEDPFHLVITRQGSQINIYVNSEIKATRDTKDVLDMENLELMLANSSNLNFIRIYNYALSQEEVTTLYNGGKPDSYVLPQAMKSQDNKCIAEYLAQNIVADPSDTNYAIGWLDSAKQLPVNDSSLPPLEESLGGYDMTASNKPQIIYKSI